MKLINSSFEIIPQSEGLQGIYKQIERASRTCYKSEDKITEDSAKGFTDRMIKSGHGAMLEHGTVYLDIPQSSKDFIRILSNYKMNKYSKIICDKFPPHISNHAYITTNYRVLVENKWLDDLQYLCEPTEYHEKRATVKFICDRGVSHEFVRHRVFSFAQESTRYCNYSKDKFGNELTFIKPSWLDIPEGQTYWCDGLGYRVGANLNISELGFIEKSAKYNDFLYALENSEKSYFILLKQSYTPQQARSVLPNALKTELVMTGFLSDWKGFFKLRCDKAAHPDARALAVPLESVLIK